MAFGDKKSSRQEESSVKTIEINAEMNGSLTFKDSVDLKINGLFSGSLDIKGTLTVGADADITVMDPAREWVYDVNQTASKSRNTPFHGWSLKGKAVATIVGGRVAWQEK